MWLLCFLSGYIDGHVYVRLKQPLELSGVGAWPEAFPFPFPVALAFGAIVKTFEHFC
jgi:hypothetical protein